MFLRLKKLPITKLERNVTKANIEEIDALVGLIQVLVLRWILLNKWNKIVDFVKSFFITFRRKVASNLQKSANHHQVGDFVKNQQMSSSSSDEFVEVDFRATKRRRLDDSEEEMTQAGFLESPERKNVMLGERMTYVQLERENFRLMYENGELKQTLELFIDKLESCERKVKLLERQRDDWKAKFQRFFRG